MPNVAFTDVYPDGAGSVAAGGPGSLQQFNPDFPGMPVGASPVHRDVTITTATITDLWTPGAGRRFVLASAFISSDTAMRVALIDEADAQNQRPVDQNIAANGGSSPNLMSVPYVAKGAGNRLRVVTAGAGIVRVRVSGWEILD